MNLVENPKFFWISNDETTFTVEIVLPNLATTSNFIEFQKLEFHLFQGTEGNAGHLASDEWLTVCHVSSVEIFKQRAQVRPIGDTWQHMIGWKSKVDG